MTPALLAVVLWCAPIDSPFTVVIHEKYGAPMEWKDVTCVIEKGSDLYVLRRGRVRGVFAKENYSIERKD
jgi:hypothetical protein